MATLTESTIETVKATVPVLKEHGNDIILTFYRTLFARYPSVKPYFNMDRQKGGALTEEGIPVQVASLARAVVAYAEHIDNVEAILPVVERICHKHVSRGVLPVQYDAVGECLIVSIQETLGEAATEDIIKAWTEAYGFLSNAFITTEKDIKAKLSEKAGYSGMIDMKVVSNTYDEESKKYTISFVPVQHDVPPYEDDQFVSIDIVLEDGSHTMTSMKLVNKESDHLTIQFRSTKEKATVALTEAKSDDVFKVSMPCGKTSQ